jgi:hypothetical protein
VLKYRRDFMTGALVDRAVQDAATKAWEKSISGDPEAGIELDDMMGAINEQVLSVAHQLVCRTWAATWISPRGSASPA